MTKTRKLAIVMSSPFIAVMLVCMLLAAVVGYAVTGKWELRRIVNEWKEI